MPHGWQSGREKPQPLPGTPEDFIDAPFDDIERMGAVIKGNSSWRYMCY